MMNESREPLERIEVCSGFQARDEMRPSCYCSTVLIRSNLTVSQSMTCLLEVPIARIGYFFIQAIDVIMSFSLSVS